MDPVDRILRQWRRQRPDLDPATMGVIGRLSRVALKFDAEMEKTFRRYGLTASGFDVLATLRRSGDPYTLSPGELLDATMVTSGTMTNRLNRLVAKGLITQSRNPADSRGKLIALTASGLRLVDTVVEAHLATQRRLLHPLAAEEWPVLADLLARLMCDDEPPN